MFGVVTTENIEQAIERAGTKAGIKVTIVLWVQSKWLTLLIKSNSCIINTQYLMVLSVFITSKICSFDITNS